MTDDIDNQGEATRVPRPALQRPGAGWRGSRRRDVPSHTVHRCTTSEPRPSGREPRPEGRGSEGRGSEGRGSEDRGSEGRGSEGRGSEGAWAFHDAASITNHTDSRRQRPPRTAPRRAFLILDVTAALIVAGLLIVVTAAAVRHLAVARAQSDALRFCRLEAQAALNRIRAGLPADPRGGGPTAEGVTVAVARTPGTGDWAGFERCEATAVKTTLGGRQVRVTLAAYIAVQGAAP